MVNTIVRDLNMIPFCVMYFRHERDVNVMSIEKKFFFSSSMWCDNPLAFQKTSLILMNFDFRGPLILVIVIIFIIDWSEFLSYLRHRGV